MRVWKLALSIGVLLIGGSATPEDVKHAPTLETCIADTNLWSSQIAGFPRSGSELVRSGTKSLTVNDINGRMNATGECILAHPELARGTTGELPPALALLMFYAQEIETRYFDFIARHGMSSKFDDEDAAGQR